MNARDASRLRMFRNVVAELHDLMEAGDDAGHYKMVKGYVESDEGLNRLRAISIPVRRSYLPTDPVNFGKMCDILLASDSESVRERARGVRRHFDAIQHDLDSVSILDETRMAHSTILEAWLEAALYQDFGDRGKEFSQLTTRYGKTIEGIAWHLTERIAEAILMLDAVAATALGDELEDAP